MKLNNVCRLCLSEEELCWFLEYSADMKDIVLSTTGVEILTSDLVSQKICKKCSIIVMKMWHYRKKTVESDRYLRDLCEELINKGELSRSNVLIGDTIENNSSNSKDNEKTNIIHEVEEKKAKIESEKKIHSTVRAIFESYPKIKIPRLCLQSDISPFICLQMGEVEDYCKINGINCNEQTKLPVPVAIESTTAAKDNELMDVDKIIESIVEDALREKKNLKQAECAVKTICYDGRDDPSNAECVVKKGKKRKLSLDFANDISLETEHVNTITSQNEFLQLKSVKTHVCEICDAVLYKLSDLKKHYNSHGQKCPFCKKTCRSIMQKDIHIKKDCPILKAMQSDPKVKLIKLENDRNIINTYPTILEDLKFISGSAVESSLSMSMKISTIPESSSNNVDNTTPSKNSNEGTSLKNNDISTYTTVSVVKPDIRMQDGDFPIDIYDPNSCDKLLISDLLKQLTPIIPRNKKCQTTPVHDISYKVHARVPSITLKEMTKFLDKNPLPVTIENGREKMTFCETWKGPTKKIPIFWDFRKPVQLKKTDKESVPIPFDQRNVATNTSQSSSLCNNILENGNIPSSRARSCLYVASNSAVDVDSPKVYGPQKTVQPQAPLTLKSNTSSQSVKKLSASTVANTLSTISSSSKTNEPGYVNHLVKKTHLTLSPVTAVRRRNQPLILRCKSFETKKYPYLPLDMKATISSNPSDTSFNNNSSVVTQPSSSIDSKLTNTIAQTQTYRNSMTTTFPVLTVPRTSIDFPKSSQLPGSSTLNSSTSTSTFSTTVTNNSSASTVATTMITVPQNITSSSSPKPTILNANPTTLTSTSGKRRTVVISRSMCSSVSTVPAMMSQSGPKVTLLNNTNSIPSMKILKAHKVASSLPSSSVQRKIKTLRPQILLPRVISNAPSKVLPSYTSNSQNIPTVTTYCHVASTVPKTYTVQSGNTVNISSSPSTMINPAVTSSSLCSTDVVPLRTCTDFMTRTSENVMNSCNASVSVRQCQNIEIIQDKKDVQSKVCAASMNTTTSGASKKTTNITSTDIPVLGTIRVKPVWELR